MLLAEGARFELADPLRGLQFSRLAHSAALPPLHADLLHATRLSLQARRDATASAADSILFFANQLKPAHVLAQDLRYRDASIRLLVVLKDGYERAADGKA